MLPFFSASHTDPAPFREGQWRAFDKAMALAEFSLEGQLLFANPKFLVLLRLPPDGLAALTHSRLCPASQLQGAAHDTMWQALCTGNEFSGVVERICGDGSTCWLEALYAPVPGKDGTVERILMVATDVTHSKRVELARQDHLWRLSMVADNTHAAIVITDAHSRIVYSNDGFHRMFGWSAQEIGGQKLLEMVVGQHAPQQLDTLRSELRRGRPVELEEVVTGRDDARYWSKILCNPVMDAQGEWAYTVSVLLDITRSKIHEVLHQRALQAMSNDRPLMQVLEMVCEEVERLAPEVCASILQVDEQGVLHSLASPSLPFSYSSRLDGVVIGPRVGSCGTAAWLKQPVLVTDIASDPLWADYRHLILPLGFTVCWSTPILQKDGRVLGTFAFYYRHNGPEVASSFHQQLVQACTDLCALAMEREQSRQRIQQLAFYDALTGLPNRSLLETKAARLLEDAARKGLRVAVLHVDLDRFKAINDALGHTCGDELLRKVANGIRTLVQSGGVAGRLPGDEFLLAMPLDGSEQLSAWIERWQGLIARDFGQCDVEDGRSVSVGVALFPQDGTEVASLLHRAELGLYRAKSAGTGRIGFFSPELSRSARERMTLEKALRQALNSGGLQLHYQPQVALDSGHLHGVEALARWEHPELGSISPCRFIPLAEACGLMGSLGRWALDQACGQLACWRRQGLTVPAVSVNLSASNFHNLELPGIVAATLARHGLCSTDLIVELTESTLLDSDASTLQTIKRLHALGVRLSMDDFGTGYSSLSYLRRLPLTELKLDCGFVADLEHAPDARALSAAILGIGNSLGLTVVAEGVETPAQKEILQSQGYNLVQGYLFSRPLPADELGSWLADLSLLAS